MNDLVRFYREYYREQTPRAFESLFAAMLDYDFSSYHEDMRRVFHMHQQAKCMGEYKTLYSGGSTFGVFRKYEFGPNFHEIRMAVEGFLRLSHRKTLLLSDIGFGIRETPFVFHDSGRPPQCDFEVSGTWWRDSNVESLFVLISQLYERHGPVNLCALPHIWLALTNTRSFANLEAANTHMISALVNTDGIRAFGKVSSFVRDQMVDWASGCNFYTCERGRSHFIPMFYSAKEDSAVNLLSLKRTSKSFDDRVAIGSGPESCVCGRPFVPLRILPHADSVPVDSSGRPVDFKEVPLSLWDGCRSFQILQSEEGGLCVFHSSNGSAEGLGRVLSLVEGLGFSKIDQVRDRYFKTGQKIPLCWRGGSPRFLDFI